MTDSPSVDRNDDDGTRDRLARGTYRIKVGTAAATGSVLIEPSLEVIRDHEAHELLVGSRTVELVNRAFLAEVIASDDETLDPSGVTYTVTARRGSHGFAPVSGIVVGTGETVQVR